MLKYGNLLYKYKVFLLIETDSHSNPNSYSHRSTTTYLADRRYDMLPAVLSADLRSLHRNTNRLAITFSCVCHMSDT